jgi:hypothetical protein
MINAYFNYPNSQVTVHNTASCAFVRSHKKVGQRMVIIDSGNLSEQLQRLKMREYKFASTAELNDLWLKVDLQDYDLEFAIVKHFHRQLGKYYKPLSAASIESHC